MSTTVVASDHDGDGVNTVLGGNPDHAAGDHGHPEHLAHHFDSPAQQFSTSKLGMWTFLATEVLMFGGLFCAYAVYRSNHPEVYLYAHRALDPFWGMVNTIVLLASSFTMAWGVRAAQMNRKGTLQVMLALTFLGGVVFMCVKGVEYQAKWKHHLFPGTFNAFSSAFEPKKESDESAVDLKARAIHYIESHGGTPAKAGVEAHDGQSNAGEHGQSVAEAKAGEMTPAKQASAGTIAEAERLERGTEESNPASAYRIQPAAMLTADGNAGMPDAASIAAPNVVTGQTNIADEPSLGHHRLISYEELPGSDRQVLSAFFSIYFMMTGLHGVHVLVGMGIMVWLFVKASAGTFSEKYFTPVDLGGLYWHLVDLIWIFLFPLLYLIH